MTPVRRRRRAVVAAVPVVVTVLVSMVPLAGCGSESAPSPPAGVDGLVIPTPSPDPADFVRTVDNPWLPLAPGSTWTYQVIDAAGTRTLRMRVAEGRRTIAGVSTTAVVTTDRGVATTDYYAQDTAGNVWWFGEAGRWQAGRHGAEAGVAMLAKPRVGDGFRTGYRPGVVEDRAEVVSIGGRDQVPAGSYDDIVELEVSTGTAALTRHLLYARGVGLVEERSVGLTYRTLRLVRVTG